MPHRPRPPYRRPTLENLEGRRLMAASDFGQAGATIHFPEAAAAFPSATGAGQTIAVIDSGIDYMHPSLGGGFGPTKKVVGGYDFVDNDADPMDELGHGTEVAGVLAAKPRNGSGNQFQGIAPNAKLVALRVDDDDFDTPVSDEKIELALQWCVAHRTDAAFGPNGITVVNISYGQGDFDSPTVSTVYGDEIVTLRDAGVAVVASAGNGGVTENQGINSPAADPSVISVGSVGLNNTVSGFSQRGPALSLLAPGEEINTTFLGGSYGLEEGTSFSAPIVAGTVALMRNIDNTLRSADAMSILRASGTATFDGGRGSGFTRRTYPRLDLFNALSLTRARKPGNVSEQAAVGVFANQSALAVDAQGVTHIVYYDVSAKTMKYATRNTLGQWSALQTIDASLPFQGYYLSMALDPQGRPAVAYFDGTNGDLKYARDSGGQWLTANLDSKNSTGAYPSLVFDRNGLPLITYYRKTTGDLRAARGDSEGHWTIESIATAGDVGRSTAAAVDADGRVGVAYEDSTNGWVRYSQMDPRTGKWASTVADKKTRGASYLSMAFSTDDQSPYISYYDAYPADLKVAHFAERAWTSETVASRGAVGLFTTMYFAGADEPNVLYWDKTKDALFNADYDGGWTAEQLQPSGGRFATGTIDRVNAVLQYAYYKGGSVLLDVRDV